MANVLKTWDSNTVISTDDNIIDELALDMDNFYLKLDDLTSKLKILELTNYFIPIFSI